MHVQTTKQHRKQIKTQQIITNTENHPLPATPGQEEACNGHGLCLLSPDDPPAATCACDKGHEGAACQEDYGSAVSESNSIVLDWLFGVERHLSGQAMPRSLLACRMPRPARYAAKKEDNE